MSKDLSSTTNVSKRPRRRSGKIRKTDVTVAKNYLQEAEISELNRIVTMYLVYAVDQAQRHTPVTMGQWASKLDAFLAFNGRDVLKHAGKVSAEVARRLAHERYDQYRADTERLESQQPTSDFDKFVEETKKRRKKPPPEETT